MTMLLSRRAGSAVGLLVDGVFLLALLWPTNVCELPPVLSPSPEALQSTGRVLWELARAQEIHREAHGKYASRVSDLAPRRTDWDIVILRASPNSYRMRISNRTDTCAIWGGRTQPATVQPFYVNCGQSSAPRDAG